MVPEQNFKLVTLSSTLWYLSCWTNYSASFIPQPSNREHLLQTALWIWRYLCHVVHYFILFKKATESVKGKRKIVRTTINVKKEIIEKHENGICILDLSLQFGWAKLSICTIFKSKEPIKDTDVANEVAVITTHRQQTLKVEKLLLISIKENKLAMTLLWSYLGSRNELIYFVIIPMKKSFYLQTFWVTNSFQKQIKLIIWGSTIIVTYHKNSNKGQAQK